MIRKSKLFSMLLAAMFMLVICSNTLSAQLANKTDQVPGLIYVKFKPGEIKSLKNTLALEDVKAKELRDIFSQYKFKEARKIFKRAVPGKTSTKSRSGERVKLMDLSHWYAVAVDDGADIQSILEELNGDDRIESASPAFYFYPMGNPPNDSYFSYQRGLKNGTTSRDIHAVGAWNLNTGNSNVKIAVIDGGVDYNHEDLDPGNRSRVIAGYDTADNDNNPMDDIPSGEGFDGHGTLVAGVIGAITDNNQGVAGIMWNVKIMPVKIAYTSGPWWDVFGWMTGTATDGNIADGIDWATNNGAHIINMSLGGYSSAWALFFIGNPVGEAVWNANQQGVLVLAAMGNDDTSSTLYPAGFPYVMSVGATDGYDYRVSNSYWGSNWGNHINVVAPGHSSYNYSTARNDYYDDFGGTSCATPMAAGVAGLVLSESIDRGLNLSNDDIKHLIEKTADKVNPGTYSYNSKGWNVEMGYGRINVEAALNALQPPNSVTRATVYGGSSSLTWNTHQHTFYNNGGLATGNYWVKQYKVTKTISFPEAYLIAPMVWLRETTSKGWSGANPNKETSYFNITNINTTSFTVETFIYYVQYNSIGQSINQWWPVSASNVRFDYTAVGTKFTPPSNLTATLPEPLRITLTWTDNTGVEDGFKIERKAGSSGTWTQIATVGANVTTYNDDDFPYSPYYYRVRAYDGSTHTAYSNTAYIDPWHGYISGPSNLDFKERGTFVAHPDGATYEWRYRYNGTGSWSSVVSTSQTYYRTMIYDDFELQCKITKDGRTVYDTHYVEYGFVPW